MTICIAAVCPVIETVVCAVDMMISSDGASADVALKMDDVHAHGASWNVMFAGHAPRFRPLVELVRAHLAGGTLNDLTTALDAAYRVELLRRIETEVLLQYGCTREDFISKGRDWFGDVRFGYILDQIDRLSLDITLLVTGFDSGGFPHLVELSAVGVVTRFDQLRFHAIGSGRDAALGALYPDAYFCFGSTLSEIIYKICVAKFAAENAPTVGRPTFIIAFRKTGDALALRPEDIELLRRSGSNSVGHLFRNPRLLSSISNLRVRHYGKPICPPLLLRSLRRQILLSLCLLLRGHF